MNGDARQNHNLPFAGTALRLGRPPIARNEKLADSQIPSSNLLVTLSDPMRGVSDPRICNGESGAFAPSYSSEIVEPVVPPVHDSEKND